MSDPNKQERIEEFLRRSLLGEELVNTQFHLFSVKSSPSSRVAKPRVLCANNVLLAKSSKYFLDLLSSDINTASDPSLADLTGDNDVPNSAQLDDYGYGSDSDLDDCNHPVPVANTKKPKNRTVASLAGTSSKNKCAKSKDVDKLSDDGSESDSSDIFVMSPEHPTTDLRPFPLSKDGDGSAASSETAVREAQPEGDKPSTNHTAIRLRSLGSRHILVKDTAYQTWYTLLNYLYTDKFNFLPLSSATPGGQDQKSLTSSLDEPRCSAKSMYRLACKVGLDHLRDEAFAFIRSNLTEHNILKELICSLLSKHTQLLEMELDELYSHIGSSQVVTGFPDLVKRVANKELPHGADIMIGIHTRLLGARLLSMGLEKSAELEMDDELSPPPAHHVPAPSSPVSWATFTPDLEPRQKSSLHNVPVPTITLGTAPNFMKVAQVNNEEAGSAYNPPPPQRKRVLGRK